MNKKNYSSFSADSTIQSIVFNAMQEDAPKQNQDQAQAGHADNEHVVDTGTANTASSEKPTAEIAEASDTEAPADEGFDLFDDDEAWLREDEKKRQGSSVPDETAEKSADFVLNEDDDSAVVKQSEGLLGWDVLGAYNEEGKTHRGLYLRENPPIFNMKSSSGDEVSFVLTRELTRTLSKTFGDLERAYYGHRRSRGDARGFLGGDTPVEWFKKNPVRGGATALIAFFFFVILVLNILG